MRNNEIYIKNFSFVSTCQPYSVVLRRGIYFIELWGAGGGYCLEGTHAGRGAYTSGYLHLYSQQKFLIYIGGRGEDCSSSTQRTSQSCNGGASGGAQNSSSFKNGASGGGSTSIQLNASYGSRIMVAAGGGGAGHYYAGGDAGGLSSSNTVGAKSSSISKGANQTDGYLPINGQPGRNSAQHTTFDAEGSGGGGGGYYGGFSYQGTESYSNSGGAGGSSYISGHSGCSKRNDFSFYKTTMTAGNSAMKSYTNPIINTIGNSGNGFAAITRIFYSIAGKRRIIQSNILCLIITIVS